MLPGLHRRLPLVSHSGFAIPGADNNVNAVDLVLLERDVLSLGFRAGLVQHALVAVNDELLQLVRQHALHQAAAVRFDDLLQRGGDLCRGSACMAPLPMSHQRGTRHVPIYRMANMNPAAL